MVVPILTGNRRGRVIGVALLLTVIIFWLGYQSPIATPRQEALDLHPQKVPSHDTPHHHDGQVSHPHTNPVDSTEREDDLTEEHGATPTKPKTTKVPSADDDSNVGLADFGNQFATTEEAGPTATAKVECIGFEALQRKKPGPKSEGRRQFPFVRPPPECRTFRLPALENLLERMKKVIKDPDLYRLFENSYPNTLDTMVKWRGYANKTEEGSEEQTVTDEELTYVITGDIDAMWLRDSASQIFSYLPLLEPSDEFDSLASLWRGLINSHSRYIVISPYCHSFQPPPESNIPPTHNGAYHQNNPQPPYNPKLVFDCKWELDSLASFLQISAAYYTRTDDLKFFSKYSWVQAVEAAVDASAAMRLGTYDEEGRVLPSAWTFTGWTNRGSETLTNDGLGNPVKENGMVRSAFRPSDDACIFQLLTPSNMMFAAYLEQASVIMEGLAEQKLDPKAANLTTEMRKLAKTIRHGIAKDAVVKHRDFGEIFAYEVDGYGGANLMDDANVPSLLAFPLWNYTNTKAGSTTSRMLKSVNKNLGARNGTIEKNSAEKEKNDEVEHNYAKIYQNTRKFVLSMANPYYAQGPALSAVGGPHLGPGKGWPMAATVAALTAFEDLSGFSAEERERVVGEQMLMVLNSTSGAGVIHETVNAWREFDFTRSWFGWANGLFGELILKIAEDEERRGVGEKGLLGKLYQD
ncbi:hypothetical protein QBC40DRAFT_288703 [Triangularia verruculosa]|uniref:Uncharacterized protein n=1 Tax=Triangularia verruculosa TaxID=2587418 RepID=A0AAN6X9U2_9PEZI|nr:hypothetical protein QBC40DRAFT_288703 [Triangularia verruculosa]